MAIGAIKNPYELSFRKENILPCVSIGTVRVAVARPSPRCRATRRIINSKDRHERKIVGIILAAHDETIISIDGRVTKPLYKPGISKLNGRPAARIDTQDTPGPTSIVD